MTRRVRIWFMPLVLAVCSTIGLVAALLADGWGDALSWLTLSVPIVCVCGCLWRSPSLGLGR